MGRTRELLAVAAVGVANVALALFFLGPILSDPNALDPDAANIVPATGPEAATVVTRAPADSMTPGVEGSVLFVRLTAPDGTIVLDRAFDWPTDEQPSSAGRLQARGLFPRMRGQLREPG